MTAAESTDIAPRPKRTRRVLDLTGTKWGRLTVLLRRPAYKNRHTFYLCQCECGKQKYVRSQYLLEGQTISCGCRMTTHGQAKSAQRNRTPTYGSWVSMRQRCINPNAHGYKYWGGRGITVCERWDSFETFFEDMGERPPGCSIDRIDVNGNYEPSNCRWATNTVQRLNQRPRSEPKESN